MCPLAALACGAAPDPSEGAGSGTPGDAAPIAERGPWHLRLRNDTEFDLASVTVEDRVEYGALPAGEHSEYLPAEGMYSTALIEAVSGDLRVMYVPVDHVGEIEAPPGYYTYALQHAPEWRSERFPGVEWVRIELIEDAAPE